MRIAVVIPCLGEVDIIWSFSLAQVVSNTSVPIDLYTSKHFKIDEARNRGVIEALNHNATHILFWDSDCIPYRIVNKQLIFDRKILDYMLSFNYPIVSGYYYTSKLIPNTFVYDEKEKTYKPFELNLEEKGVAYVDAAGLGFCLIDARVFRLIDPPWFDYEVRYEKKEGKLNIFEISEDINFFDKVRKAGFKVMVLGDVFCRHIHKAYIMGKDKFELASTR